ncbi:unnamed protein product [Clonostachys rhizophaga]|uniref:SET domain-containing protein n=1 Tax=Clonostachys rhizophaga TaxID=160324 RepID=A0A9N9Y8Z5_9HYPO|nr:unnamed protein product [Clonostachys rhizophaga]
MSTPLPIDVLPTWTRFNNVELDGIQVGQVEGKGLGFVADRDLTTNKGSPTLLKIPRDAVLSAEAVGDYAKVDLKFRQLLEGMGHETPRIAIMLYLMAHYRAPSGGGAGSHKGIASTPWTEYIRFLPRQIPTPTLWTEEKRLLLRGTSLEKAVNAKLATLVSEFDHLRETSADLPFWQSLLFGEDAITVKDWALVDAWYRSRCLELPNAGHSMVPCLDMANHSDAPNAYYEETADGEVVLVLRPESTASCGDEVTISYGAAKSAAEMLFSYGFIDRSTAKEEITLTLDPLASDPLAQAKVHVYGRSPLVRLTRTKGAAAVSWHSPFVYLMCVNEEDGLEFKLLQDNAGGRELRVFWQDEDVTSKIDDFESHIQTHDLHSVFQLRVVSVLQQLVEAQLEQTRSSPIPEQEHDASSRHAGGADYVRIVATLREMECSLLEEAMASLAEQQAALLLEDDVRVYLGLTEDGPIETPSAQVTNEEPDFS